MSLDKAIEHGKEKRKPYRGWKKYDTSCRNHGSDEWERGNRLIQREKALAKAKQKEKEFNAKKE